MHIVTHLNAVNHVVAGFFLVLTLVSLLQRLQPLRLSFFQLGIAVLFTCDLFKQLLDLEVLHLQLALLHRCLSPLLLTFNLSQAFDEFDVALVLMLSLFEIIDVFNEFNILLHKSLVN